MKKQKKTSQRGKIIVKLKTKEISLRKMHNNCNIKHKLNNRFKKINRKMEKRKKK